MSGEVLSADSVAEEPQKIRAIQIRAGSQARQSRVLRITARSKAWNRREGKRNFR